MHPWMLPDREFQLWPDDPEGIYGAFDRIFDCRGHGWSNLQSMHINLPFADDRQFFGLHAAVRFILPLLPALAASSPLMEGVYTAHLDERLAVYRSNARMVPEVAGLVVPESYKSRREYEDKLLKSIYTALAPHDPSGALCEEWVNARGAIARFDRMAIEIRVLDAQEAPRADLATAYLVVETLRPLALANHFCELDDAFPAERLAAIYQTVVRDGEEALVCDAEFLAAWGLPAARALQVKEIWQELLGRVHMQPGQTELFQDAKLTVQQGPLARRIRRTLGPEPSRDALRRVYLQLCDCLRRNERFVG
jgi:gamma-glutamyl:cysteine ligase YbdK (ATP-grasp superfamily)